MISCPNCQSPLPLRPSTGNEFPFVWTCVQCETQINGVLVGNPTDEFRDRVRLALFRFDARGLPVSDTTRNPRPVRDERRDSPRLLIDMVVPTLELTEKFHPVGNIQMNRAVNISQSGIALLCTQKIGTKYVAIQLTGLTDDPVQVTAEAIRSERSGTRFLVGCRFVDRTYG